MNQDGVDRTLTLILCFGEVLALRLYIDGPPLEIANFTQLKVEVAKILGNLSSDIPLTIPSSLAKAVASIAIVIPGIGVIAGVLARLAND